MTQVALNSTTDASSDSPLQGILLILFGIGIFTIQDALIRLLSVRYPAFEIMLIRGFIAIWPMAFFVYMQGGFASLKTKHPFLQALRGMLMVGSYTTFYMSLAAMPIAEVTAIFFISPLIITLLSVAILREEVGLRRWVAVVLGFVGVLVIVQPGSSTMNPAAFLPLISSFLYGLSVMITRKLGKNQSGASMAFFAMLTFIVFSLISGAVMGDGSYAIDSHASLEFLTRAWVVPQVEDFAMLIAIGFIAAVGFYCLSQGYRVAPASTVAPFEYSAMPLAVMWGIFIWGEYPPLTTYMGIALIIGSGLYVLHRESVQKRYLNTEPIVGIKQ